MRFAIRFVSDDIPTNTLKINGEGRAHRDGKRWPPVEMYCASAFSS